MQGVVGEVAELSGCGITQVWKWHCSVLLPAKTTGLPKDSVANVSQVVTLDRDFLLELAGRFRGSERGLTGAGSRARIILREF